MNIRNFFRSSKKSFFATDAEGKDIFYPWGAPGESFYVDEKQKKYLTVLYYIVGAVFVVFTIQPAYFEDVSVALGFCIFTINTAIFFFLYCIYMYFFTKKLRLHVSEKKDVPFKNIRFFIVLLFLQILFSALSLSVYESFTVQLAILLSLNGLYCIGLFYLIALTYKTKGYYLTGAKKAADEQAA